MRTCYSMLAVLLSGPTATNGFALVKSGQKVRLLVPSLFESADDLVENDNNDLSNRRRSFLSSVFGSGVILSGFPGLALGAEGDDESFASIAARAAQLSSEVGGKSIAATPKSDDPRTAYDFTLPVAGEVMQFRDIVRQEYDSDGRAKVKAILVVNMKEDDPTARKDIPEFISLASK